MHSASHMLSFVVSVTVALAAWTPYCLVLLRLLCQRLPPLLALDLDLLSLQLLHGHLIFLPHSSYCMSFTDHQGLAGPSLDVRSPTLTLVWCSSCTVCSCIRARFRASLACPVATHEKWSTMNCQQPPQGDKEQCFYFDLRGKNIPHAWD